MFQNKTQKILKLILINGLILTLAASCSKAPSGVRAQVKSQANVLNPNTSTAATQQAASNGVNYTISTISTPQANASGGFDINVELQMPSGQILPVTTHHDSSNYFSEGVYTDANGVKVDIQGNCSSEGSCNKYLLLVTVYKNNQAAYQSFAISYSNDCKFNLAAGTSFNSISAAENAYLGVQPQNDLDSCTQ
ncbi:MAG: hypothetical protein ACXWQQ_04770 [Pseudobdellovibrio sp.]